MGSKGATYSVYHYLMTIDYGVCYGPIDSINQIYVKEKPIWCGYLTEPASIFVNQPSLFGGDEKEGGVVGVVDCYFGTETQRMSGSAAARLGGTSDEVPGYRDICHLFFRGAENGETSGLTEPGSEDLPTFNPVYGAETENFDYSITPETSRRKGFEWIMNNPYLPGAWVNLTRLPKSLSSLYTKIFDPTAPNFVESDPDTYYFVVAPNEPPVEYTGPAVDNYGSAPTAYTTVDLLALGISQYQIDEGLVRFKSDASVTFYSATFPPDGVVVTRFEMFADSEAEPGTPGMSLGFYSNSFSHTPPDVGSATLFVERDFVTVLPGTRFVRVAGNYVATFSLFTSVTGSSSHWYCEADAVIPAHCDVEEGTLGYLVDANPVHMIYEAMTNSDWGRGGSASEFNLPVWIDAAKTLFNEKFGLTMGWFEQATVESFVKEVLDHILATVYQHPETGLWEIALFREGADDEILLELDPSNTVATNRQRKALSETINEIVVTYTDPQTEGEKTITFQDMASIAMQGQIISETRNYYGIRNDWLANQVGARDIRSAAYPLFSANVDVDRTVGQLLPGMRVKFSWPEDGIENMVCRVLTVERGRPGDQTWIAALTEDIFSLEKTAYTTVQKTAWVDPDRPPAPFDHQQAMDLPVALLVRSGVASTALSDGNYPQAGVALLAGHDGAAQVERFDVIGETVKANGEVVEAVRASLRPTPSGVLPADLSGVSLSAERAYPDVTYETVYSSSAYSAKGNRVLVARTVTISGVRVNMDATTGDNYEMVLAAMSAGAITALLGTSGTVAMTATAQGDVTFEMIEPVVVEAGTELAVILVNKAGTSVPARPNFPNAIPVWPDSDLFSFVANIRYGTTVPTVGQTPATSGNSSRVDMDLIYREGPEAGFSFWTHDEVTAFTGRYQPQGGDFLLIGDGAAQDEIVMLYHRDALTGDWKVARGMFDTVPKAWSAGSRCWFLDSTLAAQLDPYSHSAGAESSVRLLPWSSGGPGRLSTIEPLVFTPSDRGYAPTRPANTQIDGADIVAGATYRDYDPGGIPSSVMLTWANRNRRQEDSVAPLWSDGNVTPEEGQTTTIRVRALASGALVEEVADLTGTSYELDISGLTEYSFYAVEFWSARDGFESLQAVSMPLNLLRSGYGFDYGNNYGAPSP